MAKERLKRAGEVFEADLAHDLEDPAFARIYALKLAKINAIPHAIPPLTQGSRADRRCDPAWLRGYQLRRLVLRRLRD